MNIGGRRSLQQSSLHYIRRHSNHHHTNTPIGRHQPLRNDQQNDQSPSDLTLTSSCIQSPQSHNHLLHQSYGIRTTPLSGTTVPMFSNAKLCMNPNTSSRLIMNNSSQIHPLSHSITSHSSFWFTHLFPFAPKPTTTIINPLQPYFHSFQSRISLLQQHHRRSRHLITSFISLFPSIRSITGIGVCLSVIPYSQTQNHPWAVSPTQIPRDIIPVDSKQYHYHVISKDHTARLKAKMDNFSLFITYILEQDGILNRNDYQHKFVHKWPEIPDWIHFDKDGKTLNSYVVERIGRYGLDILTLDWCFGYIPEIFRFCNDESAVNSSHIAALSGNQWDSIIKYKTFVEKERFKLLRDFESGVSMQDQLIQILSTTLDMIETQCTIPDDITRQMRFIVQKRQFSIRQERRKLEQELDQLQIKVNTHVKTPKHKQYMDIGHIEQRQHDIRQKLDHLSQTEQHLAFIPQFMIPSQILPLYESLLNSLANACEIHTVFLTLQDALASYDSLIQEEYNRQKSIQDTNPQQKELFYEPVQDLLTRQSQIVDAANKTTRQFNQQIHFKLTQFENYFEPRKIREYQRLLKEYREYQVKLITSHDKLSSKERSELELRCDQTGVALTHVNPLIEEIQMIETSDTQTNNNNNNKYNKIVHLAPSFGLDFFMIFSHLRKVMKAGTFFEPESTPYIPFEHLPFHWDPKHVTKDLPILTPQERHNRFAISMSYLEQIKLDRASQLAPILHATRELSRQSWEQNRQAGKTSPIPNAMVSRDMGIYSSQVLEAESLVKKAKEEGIPEMITKAEALLQRRMRDLKSRQQLLARQESGDVVLPDGFRMLTPEEQEKQEQKAIADYEARKKKWKRNHKREYILKDQRKPDGSPIFVTKNDKTILSPEEKAEKARLKSQKEWLANLQKPSSLD